MKLGTNSLPCQSPIYSIRDRSGKYSHELRYIITRDYAIVCRTANLILPTVKRSEVDRCAATANCRTGKEEELTTGGRHDLVQQLHVGSLPDLLYDAS